jgi:molecular chaperone GrpE
MKKDIKTKEIMLSGQLARALADYDNLRKRVEKEKQIFEKVSNLRLVVKLLPVLDIIKKSQAHVKDPGIALTVEEFEKALISEGIEEIKVKVGDEFNPEIHEAIEVVGNPLSKGKAKVDEILLTGWRFIEGPVIRHTKVRVKKEEK